MTPSQLGRTGSLPRTAWADRVRVLADASGVSVDGLGELLEAEVARSDGILFTVTPAEELDEVSRWQRLADAAWCGQVRTIVAMHNRMSAAERELLACETALALNLSDGCAQDIVATALMAADAPGLVEAVEAGLLTVRHVHAVLKELSGCGLSTEEQHAVITVTLVRYAGETPVELGKLVARLLLTVHGAAAAAKEADATYRRRVRVRSVEDGQGILVARGPLWMIEQMRAALAKQAAAAAGEGLDAHGEAGRTRDAIEFDLLHDLILGRSTGVTGGGWTAAIVMPESIARGDDRALAEIPGMGPVLPDTARSLLAAAATVQRIVVDAEGQVVDVSRPLPGPGVPSTGTDPHASLQQLRDLPSTGEPEAAQGYRPHDRLSEYVRARELTCTFPGCNKPAARCDLDHRVAYPRGATSADNLQPLCRRHHRAKQVLFVVQRLADGTTRWITRGGWWFDRPPRSYLALPEDE